MALSLVGVIGMIKQAVLLYLAYFSYKTLSFVSSTMYIFGLVVCGSFGIYEIDVFTDDTAGIFVYLCLCVTQIIFAFFITQYLIDYNNAQHNRLKEPLTAGANKSANGKQTNNNNTAAGIQKV